MTGRPDFIDSQYYTVEEYFALEEKSETKHDYFNGRILDMAGGTADHNSIAINIAAECRQALKGKPCRVFALDQRLQAFDDTHYTYPDVQIVCGEPEYAAGDKNRVTITNPKVVVEVLSSSTEAYDRGDKFKSYIALPSLTDYVLVSQHAPRIDVFHRQDDGAWRVSWVEGLDATLHVPSVDVSVPLAEIYRNVTFEPPATNAPAPS